MSAVSWEDIVAHSVYPQGCPQIGSDDPNIADPQAWRKDSRRIDELVDLFGEVFCIEPAHCKNVRKAIVSLLSQCKGSFDGVKAVLQWASEYEQKGLRQWAQSRSPFAVIPTLQAKWARTKRVAEEPHEAKREDFKDWEWRRMSPDNRRKIIAAECGLDVDKVNDDPDYR